MTLNTTDLSNSDRPRKPLPVLTIILAWICLSAALLVNGCANAPGKLPYRAEGQAIRSFPHDQDAFTQGLVFDDDALYESTGLHGESSLRHVDLESGKVLQIHRLPSDLFAEGCTVWEDTIVQLTWRAGLGFVYDKESFEPERRFSYDGEGWGLTEDGHRLIMSDGTSYIRFLDPETLQETGRVKVLDRGEPVDRLNELEWVDGEVWANVWQTPSVVRIDPKSGQVLGWIDFSDLTELEPRGVLNGIAKKGERIFVTGKRWTSIYQVEIRPAEYTSSAR